MTERSLDERFAVFDRNYQEISERIARAAERSGRGPGDITLLAATKTVPVEVINHAISRGLTHLGENRVQELLDKYDRLDKEGCDLQFIGQLQTNKVKYLIGRVGCIQSVDSVKLAREISRLSEREGLCMDALVEVNIGREENKGGVMPEALLEFIDEIREFYVDIKAKSMDNVDMVCLSMGMSSDFPEAIESGATMVRVGSSLFGARA